MSVERVGDVEDPSLLSASTTPSQPESSEAAGKSRSVAAGSKDPSVWTVALLRTFCEQHGLKRSGKKQDLLTR